MLRMGYNVVLSANAFLLLLFLWWQFGVFQGVTAELQEAGGRRTPGSSSRVVLSDQFNEDSSK